MSDELYCIVRFRWDTPGGEVVLVDLSREEAEEHCQREDTHGEGWFDGFDLMSDRPTAVAEYRAQHA